MPFIGPEFVAHFLHERPNGHDPAETPPVARLRGGAFDKPTFSLKVRLTLIEMTQLEERSKGESE